MGRPRLEIDKRLVTITDKGAASMIASTVAAVAINTVTMVACINRCMKSASVRGGQNVAKNSEADCSDWLLISDARLKSETANELHSSNDNTILSMTRELRSGSLEDVILKTAIREPSLCLKLRLMAPIQRVDHRVADLFSRHIEHYLPVAQANDASQVTSRQFNLMQGTNDRLLI